MSVLLCEPEYLKINNFKATSANDIIPKNIINDFTTIMNINVDMITLRSTLLELFGTVLEGMMIQPSENEVIQATTTDNKWDRLCSLVKNISTSGIVDSMLLKTSLELNLLVGAGLTKDEAGLNKKLIKINTGLVYKQQKYNLLREETEGYSKLTMVLSSLPPPQEDISAHIKNILSLVGRFDLDPNRVIDVILDAFEDQTWNLSFLQILQQFRRDKVRHILGFKFTSYHLKDDKEEKGEEANNKSQIPAPAPAPEKEKSKSAPASLYALTALLIATNFISIEEILPYLNPSAADAGQISILEDKELIKNIKTFSMNEQNKQNEANKKFLETSLEPSFGTSASSSSLNKASATPTSGLSNSQSNSTLNGKSDINKDGKQKTILTNNYEIESIEKYGNGNQIIGLLAALLEIRCMDAAKPLFALLESHGVKVMNYKDVRKAMIDLLSWSISDLYDSVSKKHLKLSKDLSKPVINVVPQLSGQFQKFNSFQNLPEDLAPTLEILGIWLCDSPALFTQLCRLFHKYLETKIPKITGDMKESLSVILNIFSKIMLPALSIGAPNAFLTDQVWKAFGMLPFQIRFQSYDIWGGSGMGKEGIGSKSYQQSLAEERSSFYSRRLLKRLQKENVRQTGRQLAIETHSNAMVAYTIVIDQIQNYDSLIPYIVDALKYSTALARDVMAFCLVKQLQKNSEKLKRDATYTPWFTALAKFTGAFYRKYYTTEIKGLLHLILQTLSQGHSYDLLLLKELLSRMGGCDSILDISDAAVESISGGKVLKGEVTVSFEAPAKKAQTLLRDELLDSKTAIPILLFMAKIRSKIIYDTDTTELKLISTLSDTCQDLLIQFSDFLLGCTLSSKAMETISSIMPSLSTLIDEIGLALPVAFQLVRSLMRQAFSYGENVKSAPGYLRKWHPFNPEIVSVVKKRMPEETWSIISEESFIIFWTINLQDIVIPTAKYESENKRLRDKYAEIDKSLSLSNDAKVSKEKKAEMSKILSTIKELSDELDSQQKHVTKIRAMVTSRANKFFNHTQQSDFLKITEILFQTCVLPRIMMSPADSIFSSQFLLLLHQLETPGFSTIHAMDQMLRSIAPLIFCTTEAEAGFIGYIINDILSIVNKWLEDKKVFEEESQKKSFVSINPLSTDSKVSYDEYLNIFKVWHQKLQVLIMKSLGEGLEQRKREYMHIRSGLVFLSKLVNNFPSRINGGKELLRQVEIVDKEEMDKRSDLSLYAKRLGSIMQKRKSSWVDDDGNKVSSPIIKAKDTSKANNNVTTTSKPTTSSTSAIKSTTAPATATIKSTTAPAASTSKGNTTSNSGATLSKNLKSNEKSTPNSSTPINQKDEKEIGRKREREKDDKDNEKNNKERKIDSNNDTNKSNNNKDNSSISKDKDKDKDNKDKDGKDKTSNQSNPKVDEKDSDKKSKDSGNKGNLGGKEKERSSSNLQDKDRSNSFTDVSKVTAGQKRDRDTLEKDYRNTNSQTSSLQSNNYRRSDTSKGPDKGPNDRDRGDIRGGDNRGDNRGRDNDFPREHHRDNYPPSRDHNSNYHHRGGARDRDNNNSNYQRDRGGRR